MSAPVLFGLLGAALSAVGVYGLMVGRDALARILAFNLLGGGVFLVFGAVARRGAGAGFGADPVPQALVITGIVVAFSATALAVALLKRLAALRARPGAALAKVTGAQAEGATGRVQPGGDA